MGKWGKYFLVVWLWLWAMAGYGPSGAAHTRSQSFSSWTLNDGRADVVFAVDGRRLTQLARLYPQSNELESLFETHVKETVSVRQAGEACPLSRLKVRGVGEGMYRLSGRFICAQPFGDVPAVARIRAFFKVSPTHIHMAQMSDGADFILHEHKTDLLLTSEKQVETLGDFISLGFWHILSGADHIVFLLALAMVVRQPQLAVVSISGFTVGHMVALGLMSYGVITPDMRWVEALIGTTIALMALEAGCCLYGLSRQRIFIGFAVLTWIVFLLAGNETRSGLMLGLPLYILASAQLSVAVALRALPVMTVIFGLVHGTGFGTALQALSVGQVGIWRPLLGFNLGVEIGQLLILCTLYGVYGGMRKWTAFQPARWEKLTCLGVFGLGCFWFAGRAWL